MLCVLRVLYICLLDDASVKRATCLLHGAHFPSISVAVELSFMRIKAKRVETFVFLSQRFFEDFKPSSWMHYTARIFS